MGQYVNNKKILAGLFLSACMFVQALPLQTFAVNTTPDDGASGLVPCGNQENAQEAAESCNLPALVLLIKNVINFLFLLSIPIATIAFMYTGILLLTAQGNVAKIQRAKDIALKVLIGFLFIVGAWAIVYEITSRLFVEQAQYLTP